MGIYRLYTGDTGQGHTTRIIDGEPVRQAVIPLVETE